jgi:rRNA-processing protein FCF1
VTTVVMDTNALMMPVECDVRLFDELARLLGESVEAMDLVVPRAVVAELDALAPGASKEAVAASVGRDLADRCRVVDTTAEYADDAVVELTDDADYVVTNDRPLRGRLLDRGVPVVGLRGRNTLAITEP